MTAHKYQMLFTLNHVSNIKMKILAIHPFLSEHGLINTHVFLCF